MTGLSYLCSVLAVIVLGQATRAPSAASRRDPQREAYFSWSAAQAEAVGRSMYARGRVGGIFDTRLLRAFEEKFVDVRYNMVHILKSLIYFADADREPMPDMVTPLAWDQVKQFLTTEVLRVNKLQ